MHSCVSCAAQMMWEVVTFALPFIVITAAFATTMTAVSCWANDLFALCNRYRISCLFSKPVCAMGTAGRI